LLCHHKLSTAWLISSLAISAAGHKIDIRMFLNVTLIQLRRDLTQTKEKHNCCYAIRRYETAKQIL